LEYEGFTFLLLKEALLESFNLQKKTNNEREIKCFIVGYQTVRRTNWSLD